MAVSGVSSSTSIYGNRNVLTGLASGLDTESMIENAIAAYKNKITALQQKRTKTEWKQDAYRSIIDKMSMFSDKYTSYNSSTNLMSTSFFDQAVRTVTKGANAAKVAASGKTSSNVEINNVLQLATSSRYAISGGIIDTSLKSPDKNVNAVSTGSFSLDGPMELGTLSGSMTIGYGGSDARSYLSVSFDESQIFNSAQDLADEINKQLSEQTITIGSTAYTGDELLNEVVKAEVDPITNVITLTDPKKNGAFINSASESVKNVLLYGEDPGEKVKSLKGLVRGDGILKTEKDDVIGYLNESAPLSITLNGVTKTVKMPTKDELLAGLNDLNAEYKKENNKDIPYFEALKKKIENGDELTSSASKQFRDEAYAKALQKNIDKAFGAGKLKVSDNMDDKSGESGFQLKFEASQGSTFQVKSGKSTILGLDKTNGTTSYLNTSKTLGDILGDRLENGNFETVKQVKKITNYDGQQVDATDENGDPIYEDKLDDKGNKVYSFKVNGVEVGQYTKDTSLSTILNDITKNKEAGVTASYSKTTNELVFTAKNTGEAETIRFEGLSAELFGDPSNEATRADGTKYGSRGTFTPGQDAVFTATVNGQEIEMTRASNNVDIDGMTVTLKGTFGYKNAAAGDAGAVQASDGKYYVKEENVEAVSFETSSDSDKIVDAIKSMVEDYNAMVTEIKNAYSTLPQQRSSGAYYEPLTDEDQEDMSESAIKAWEDKAKIGLLFGDNDLRQLYSRLTKSISMYGENLSDLKAAGITVNYSNGLSTLKLDEQALRDTLNSDPDRVRDIFTKDDGIMQSMKVPLDQYGKTTGGKGILVDKAGSVLAPSTLYSNNLYKELASIDEQIEKWQEKMEDRVDYYTSQFSRLEQLISQANSQSSYFAQLSGGY